MKRHLVLATFAAALMTLVIATREARSSERVQPDQLADARDRLLVLLTLVRHDRASSVS